MQNQPRRRAAADERAQSASLVPTQAPGNTPKSAKPQIRQYDLVERVRRYNPNTDEALLDRAYVYAMKAHGTQTRA